MITDACYACRGSRTAQLHRSGCAPGGRFYWRLEMDSVAPEYRKSWLQKHGREAFDMTTQDREWFPSVTETPVRVSSVTETVTETPAITVTVEPISVTAPTPINAEPDRKVGRPKQQDALSAADKQRAYRERQRDNA